MCSTYRSVGNERQDLYLKEHDHLKRFAAGWGVEEGFVIARSVFLKPSH